MDPIDADAALLGDPLGTHRVLEPAGGLPTRAFRLDAAPDLWDGELRLSLEHLLLSDQGFEHLCRTTGGDPLSARAALLSASAERGGLPPELDDTVVVGHVAAVGRARPADPGAGARVAVPGGAAALPMWLRDLSRWSGSSPQVPVSGHAIVHAATPLVRVPADLPPQLAAAATAVARLAEELQEFQPRRVLVVDAATVPGAVAVAAAVGLGASVSAVVTSLQEARLVQALGPVATVIAPIRQPAVALQEIAAAVDGPADVVVGGSPTDEVAVLAASAAPSVLVLPVAGTDVTLATRVALAAGFTPQLVTGGRPAAGSGTIFELLRAHPVLAEILRWRAGIGPQPAAARPEGS